MDSEGFLESLSGITEGSLSQIVLRLVVAIAILMVGRLLAKFLSNSLRRALTKGKVDETLIAFADRVFYYGLIVIAVIIALTYLGVPTTSIVAILGAGTLAIGLALQDTIANIAGGLSVIVLRPFRVGDFVEVADDSGFVNQIGLFHTLLRTPENKSVYVPNREVIGNSIVNYSDTELIRLELVYGISYDDDVLLAKRILEEIVAEDERIAERPPTIVAVKELADNSVNLTVRPYVHVEDGPAVTFAVTEQVKLRFDEQGLSIPFPQRDIHLFQAN